MTARAASASWATSAAIAARIASSTSEPIRRIVVLDLAHLLVEAAVAAGCVAVMRRGRARRALDERLGDDLRRLGLWRVVDGSLVRSSDRPRRAAHPNRPET